MTTVLLRLGADLKLAPPSNKRRTYLRQLQSLFAAIKDKTIKL